MYNAWKIELKSIFGVSFQFSCQESTETVLKKKAFSPGKWWCIVFVLWHYGLCMYVHTMNRKESIPSFRFVKCIFLNIICDQRP